MITVPVSYWAGGSVEVLTDQYLKAVAFFWLVGTLATTERRLRTIAWTLVLCAIPLAVDRHQELSARATSSRPASRASRASPATWAARASPANPNDLALMLNLIIPIAAALMIGTRGIAARAVAAVAMLLSVAGVIVTFSRAGFLTLAATVVMLLAVLDPAPVRRRGVVAAAARPGRAAAACPTATSDRLSTITNIETDQTGSAQGRWQDFMVAADVVAQNPIVGAGIGNDMLALNKSAARTRGGRSTTPISSTRWTSACRACCCSPGCTHVLPQRAARRATGAAARPGAPATRRRSPPASRSRSSRSSSPRCFTRSPISSISSPSPAWPWR